MELALTVQVTYSALTHHGPPMPQYISSTKSTSTSRVATQYIGQLFRTRFKGSQFIVISLKEGLFTNANVLFRARFRDGTSIVERSAQGSASSIYDKENDGEEARRARREPKTIASVV
jgi:structural maintenance of chromosome 2